MGGTNHRICSFTLLSVTATDKATNIYGSDDDRRESECAYLKPWSSRPLFPAPLAPSEIPHCICCLVPAEALMSNSTLTRGRLCCVLRIEERLDTRLVALTVQSGGQSSRTSWWRLYMYSGCDDGTSISADRGFHGTFHFVTLEARVCCRT